MPEKVARTYALQVRLTPQQEEKLKRDAAAAGMSVSAYARLLFAIPVEVVCEPFCDEDAILVFDVATLRETKSQLRRWGYHLDHALKALNTVAAKHFLSQQDTYDLVTEATGYIKDVSELKEDLKEKITYLSKRDSVKVDCPIKVFKDPNTCMSVEVHEGDV